MEHALILLVDDDHLTLEALTAGLKLRLARVTVHTTLLPDGALKRISCTDYDVVISDINMPGIDGLNLLSHIQILRPNLPVLLISGHECAQTTSTAVSGRAFAFLPKPID